ITHIVQQTLGFYREASSPVPVKVSHLLDNVLQLYSRRLGLRGVRVEKTYEFDKDIEVFPGEMRQVFSNLVANAIEALPPGGRVRLHLYPSRNWHTLEEGIRVVVADNGPGISPENRRQIFEPFFTTKGERGTGLGLWVSRGIVQKHGGRLTMRSTTRHGCSGTVFSVFLPCAREKRLRATSSETAA
ncbi:MAG TPA: HAMP domain-containing sensor histidine kinase, partial [Terriglobales bacterium]|nr:HAMP domain-containing sensor histidine kinase [Terriglobales bacterium]